MESSIDEQLTVIVENCKAVLNENLISIILFGSTARGDDNAHSDIDVCLVVEEYPRNDWKVAGRIKYKCLSEGVSKSVEPIFLEADDLEFPSPILYEISRDGQTIFGHDILAELRTLCADIKPIFTAGGEKIGWRIDSNEIPKNHLSHPFDDNINFMGANRRGR
jgi:predicted nucleotidyltransferase